MFMFRYANDAISNYRHMDKSTYTVFLKSIKSLFNLVDILRVKGFKRGFFGYPFLSL